MTERFEATAIGRFILAARASETFNRDNVTLVDVRTDPIEAIIPAGVRLQSGAEHAADFVVFAIGFDAMTGTPLWMGIRGWDRLPLEYAWEAEPRNYSGLQVPGFPNMFTITGPGSPSALCNMPVPIEQHVEWIADCISHLRKHGIARIEATPDATDDWAAQATRPPERRYCRRSSTPGTGARTFRGSHECSCRMAAG